jgi:hypothetical protein
VNINVAWDVVRPLILLLATVAAWLIYAAGLIAPLTPSEGYPSAKALLVFLAGPVVLLVFVARSTRSRAVRILSLIQAASILAITTGLLALYAGVWQALFR